MRLRDHKKDKQNVLLAWCNKNNIMIKTCEQSKVWISECLTEKWSFHSHVFVHICDICWNSISITTNIFLHWPYKLHQIMWMQRRIKDSPNFWYNPDSVQLYMILRRIQSIYSQDCFWVLLIFNCTEERILYRIILYLLQKDFSITSVLPIYKHRKPK